MKLSEVTDEFSNQEVSLKHLFQVQAARCHEYALYWNFLSKVYPNLGVHYDITYFIRDKFNQYMDPSEYKKQLTSQKTLSPAEIDKAVAKFSRMVEAKKAFQLAGGKYYTFLKRKR